MHKIYLLRMVFILFTFSIMTQVSFAAQMTPDTGRTSVISSVTANFNDLIKREARAPQSSITPFVAPRHRRGAGNLPIPEGVSPTTNILQENAVAPLAPLVSSAAAPTVSGFQALVDNNTSIPPDTQGAVGPNHVMTTLNSQVRIQDKSGSVISTVSLNTFFSSLKNVNNASFSAFDPHVRFDPIGNRWVVVAAADDGASTSSTLFAASQTTDPTGSWYFISIRADGAGANWADYPALGMNKDWIVVTVNLFTNVASEFVNAQIYVLNKAQLYAGGAVTTKTFTSPNFGFQPAVTHDAALATLYLLESWNGNSGGNGYVRLSTIGGAVGSEVFSEGTFTPNVPSPWDWGSVGEIMPQLGDSRKIDGGDDRILNCVYRNSSLWCAQTVYLPAAAPTRSAAQWWQINPATGAVQQFGRVDDPTGVNSYAFPTIAVNKNNDVLLGYSSFSENQYPSASYSFRYGTDTASSLQASTLFKAGEAKYYKTFSGASNRWGDYSSTVVDPADDLTLWTIQEYSTTPVTINSVVYDRWATWWAKVTQVWPLTVTLPGTGTGTVTSNPAGINCGATCSANYNTGTSVTLTAIPDGGNTFAGWSGACSGTGTCTLTMDAAKSVAATFTHYQTLTVNNTGTGGGTVTSNPQGINPVGITCTSGTCTTTFPINTSVALTPTADNISTFGNWSVDCNGNGACNVTMDGPKSVSASFTLAPKARIASTGYASLQAAYAAAVSNDVIMTIDSEMPDNGLNIDLALSSGKTVTINGGYKADYSGISGLPTYLKWPLLISSGTLKVNGLIIH